MKHGASDMHVHINQYKMHQDHTTHSFSYLFNEELPYDIQIEQNLLEP